MLYFDFETNEQAYKLRLTTKDILNLEKKICCNPLSIFGAGDRIPSVTEMVTILHASLQSFHHGITLDNAANIFDTYLQDHTVTDFVSVIVGIYKVSGIIPNTEDAEKN